MYECVSNRTISTPFTHRARHSYNNNPLITIAPKQVMDLVKRDPLFVLVDSEEQDLQFSISDIERKLFDIGNSIRGLIENKTFLEKELEAKKSRQEECRKKKDDCSKVIVQSWVEMARRLQVPIADLSLAAILPPELLLCIFSFLTPADLCGGIARVSHKWYYLSNDNQLWRGICDDRGIELNDAAEGNARHNYMEGFRRAQNWRKGKFKAIPLSGHKEIVWSVLFDGSRIVSGSEDMTIKIWDAESAMCVNTLRGHKNGTICLSSYGQRIVSGSADGSIRIWDDESGQCLRTINTYSSVWSLQVLDNKLFAGCVDTSIRVFDVNTGQVLSTFRGHTAPVRCLQVAHSFGEAVVMSGSYDRTIKMWDLNGRCLNTIRAHTHKVNCLQYDGTTLVSGSHDTLVKVWDMSGRCLHTLQGHDNMIHCLQFKGNQLFTGSSDTTIRMWNMTTGEHINTIKNQSAVCSLQFDDTRLVSGFEDSSIQIYNFS